MFVDVEFPVDLPATLVVPADAIVDSGLRKTVFVDRGNGYFEPRLVETGWRVGDDVEVTNGLMPGERIVISGTFFVDSESRMKAATRGHRPRRCSIRCAGCTSIPGKPATPAARRRTASTCSSSARTAASSSSPPTRRATRSGRSRSHDRTHHRLLGQEQVPRPPARGRRRARRRARAAERAARRDPRPRRHAGHRLLAVGSQPRPHRGAGHVSDRDGDAWRAARASGPRRLRFWLLVRLRDLRGRHRHLLGAHADAGVPLRRAVAAAARCADRARARRNRSRLGVPVRARGPLRHTQPGGSAVVSGLVPALLPEGGARRVGGGLGRRLRPAVPGERRPEPAAQLRPLDTARRRGGARRKRRDCRSAHRVRRHRVHGARPRVREVGRRLREHRRVRQRERHADPDPRHRPRDGRPGSAARRRRSGRRSAKWCRGSS